MDSVSFRFFGLDSLDFYDGKMTNWRVNDCDFGNALIYTSYTGNSRIYESCMDCCDFRYTGLDGSTFHEGSFRRCTITNCEIQGMTIDGIPVEEALKLYRGQKAT